jgi:hypothetical protein
MKFTNFLTPQVRTFIYGAVAALLSVATFQGWVSDDLAKSINDNLPTIFGALASILAAANVSRGPATPKTDATAPSGPSMADIAAVSHVGQGGAIEIVESKK